MRLLFIDFDGVLHPASAWESAGGPLFCHVPALAAALAEHPDVRLVVTSSWRYLHKRAELRGFLGPALSGRYLGETPRLERRTRCLGAHWTTTAGISPTGQEQGSG